PLAVPLADGTAARLAALLLRDQDQAGLAEQYAELLADDPPLALWAVCRAGSTLPDLHDFRELGRWLSDHALDELASDDERLSRLDAGSRDASFSDVELGQWADAVATSLAMGRAAAELASDSLAADQAYFLAIFEGFSRSLPPCPPGIAAEHLPWPRRLADELAQLSASTLKADAVFTAVRRAREKIQSARQAVGVRREPTQRADECRAEGCSSAAWAHERDRWLARTPAVDVKALVCRLRKLRNFETDFERELETAKLDALKEFAYGAGHEINNPLANISARAQTLLQLERDPDRRRMLATIHVQALRAHEMISDLMLFARPPRPKLQVLDVAEVASEVVEQLRSRALENQVSLSLSSVEAVLASADSTQIAVAISALCTNAIEACDAGGQVRVEVSRSSKFGGTAQITVTDNGPGIPDSIRSHIFDPFFSGREAGRGLGFGLPKCWRIVSSHGGQIEVDGGPHGGACFSIFLPLAGR
ncbi:MAG TPA: HAMP domain-containing sensor histidine kinase, partial [Pirellulales bacterium]|nr:HAMP domain-containing sensor histidine kinase [Pirellulales bacterium]